MTLLSREAILKAKLKTKTVPVPEWGGDVKIREMTAAEMQAQGMEFIGPNGQPDVRRAKDVYARLVVKCVINEAGEPIFTEADVPELSKKGGSALKLLGDEIQALSGAKGDSLEAWLENYYPEILAEFKAEGGPVERAKGNFTKTRNGASYLA